MYGLYVPNLHQTFELILTNYNLWPDVYHYERFQHAGWDLWGQIATRPSNRPYIISQVSPALSIWLLKRSSRIVQSEGRNCELVQPNVTGKFSLPHYRFCWGLPASSQTLNQGRENKLTSPAMSICRRSRVGGRLVVWLSYSEPSTLTGRVLLSLLPAYRQMLIVRV